MGKSVTNFELVQTKKSKFDTRSFEIVSFVARNLRFQVYVGILEEGIHTKFLLVTYNSETGSELTG